MAFYFMLLRRSRLQLQVPLFRVLGIGNTIRLLIFGNILSPNPSCNLQFYDKAGSVLV